MSRKKNCFITLCPQNKPRLDKYLYSALEQRKYFLVMYSGFHKPTFVNISVSQLKFTYVSPSCFRDYQYFGSREFNYKLICVWFKFLIRWEHSKLKCWNFDGVIWPHSKVTTVPNFEKWRNINFNLYRRKLHIIVCPIVFLYLLL